MCAALGLGVFGLAGLDASLHAAFSLEQRKLPMKFSWNMQASEACQPACKGWISATGIVTADTVKQFEEFAAAHEAAGATVVLDSGGGSVLDAIALGRRWRELRMSTAVGTTVDVAGTLSSRRAAIMPDASCESMCVFLLLAGVNRYVPPDAQIRVHQIWMGDRAEDARAASYTAQDVSIIERDVGRLAKYTFDMGGTGDLLELALSVPPWKPLRRLTMDELRSSNLVSVQALADILPDVETLPSPMPPPETLPVQASPPRTLAPMASAKPVQDRFTGTQQKTAEARPVASAPATGNSENR